MAVSPARAADEVTQDRLLNANKEQGNWIHHHGDYASNGFSTLTGKNLKIAWMMPLGGVEGGGSRAACWAPRVASG